MALAGPVALQIGRNSSGAFGDTVLYVLGNENIGWAPMQPLAWARGDVLEMIPFPQDLCFTIQGGDNWNGARNFVWSSTPRQPFRRLSIVGFVCVWAGSQV